MSMQPCRLPSKGSMENTHCLIPAWKWMKNRLLIFERKMQLKQDVLHLVSITLNDAKRQREQLSHDECKSIQNANTASRKRKRAQQSQEEREDGRRQVLFSIGIEEDEDAVEKEVEDSGDTKKSYEDKIVEKGHEVAATLQATAKPYPGSSLSIEYGYCNNDAETEKKMSDVIGANATDEIVVQMYSEHFEQDTFKSDVAEAVINTYYNDAKVVSTTKRLVWTHTKLFDDS
eukprot:scaffold9779_cov79-Skeletonema_marinoi.AAC.1